MRSRQAGACQAWQQAARLLLAPLPCWKAAVFPLPPAASLLALDPSESPNQGRAATLEPRMLALIARCPPPQSPQKLGATRPWPAPWWTSWGWVSAAIRSRSCLPHMRHAVLCVEAAARAGRGARPAWCAVRLQHPLAGCAVVSADSLRPSSVPGTFSNALLQGRT